jgi:hypothetical protein
MIPVIISTLVMAVTVFIALYFIDNLYLKLLFGGLIGLISYLFMSYIFKAQELKEIKKMLMKIRN